MPKPRPFGFERADLGDAARLRFLGPHQPLPEVPDRGVEGGRARLDLATLVQSGCPGGSYLEHLGLQLREPAFTDRRGSFEARLLVPRLVEAILQPRDLYAKISRSRLPPLDLLPSGSDRGLSQQQGLFGLGSFAVQVPEAIRGRLLGPGQGAQFGLRLLPLGLKQCDRLIPPGDVLLAPLLILPFADQRHLQRMDLLIQRLHPFHLRVQVGLDLVQVRLRGAQLLLQFSQPRSQIPEFALAAHGPRHRARRASTDDAVRREDLAAQRHQQRLPFRRHGLPQAKRLLQRLHHHHASQQVGDEVFISGARGHQIPRRPHHTGTSPARGGTRLPHARPLRDERPAGSSLGLQYL